MTGSKARNEGCGLTEWESRVARIKRWQRLYLHPYIHTYIHIGTISVQTGEVEKDSDSSYISHQHISPYV